MVGLLPSICQINMLEMVAALFTIRIYHKMQQTKQCTLMLAILQLSLESMNKKLQTK